MAISSLSTSSMVSGVKRRKIWDQSATTDGFFQIATTTLNTAAASIEFNSIPQTYTHLQIRAIGRSTSTSPDTYLQINGVTAGGNYSYHYVYGDGASVASGSDTSQGFLIGLRTATSNNSANIFGVGVIDILDYTNTNKFKTVRTLSGFDGNGSGLTWLVSGNYRSTNAITSLKFTASSVSFAQYSSFDLYGIKG